MKVKEGRFGLDKRKAFYMMRAVKQWNIPREVLGAPYREALKSRLDRILRNVSELKMSLLIARDVKLDDH